jgi:voltage-gated potassium channel
MAAKADHSELLVLRRKRRISGWYELAWRVAAVAALTGFLILFHWLEREGLKDTHDGHVSFLDVIYFTMISATTTGYGDIVPVTENTRLFDALVVTPIRIFFLLIFIGSAYLFVAKRTWERFLMKRIQRSLCDHTVVVGYGTKNTRAVAELIDLGAQPSNIVVVDLDEERLDHAKAAGCTVLKGDATLDETLRALRVDRAKLVIISAGRDDTSILVCLTTRHLAPNVRISVAVNHQNNEVSAKLAGADVVVNPFDFAGLLLATTHSGHHIADYLADLATMQGRVRLVEREVRPEEVGTSLRDLQDTLGLRIIRGGKAYGFWRPQVKELQLGDVIMEIQPTVVD